MSESTRLPHDVQSDDLSTTDRLLPIVYRELRAIAGRKLSFEPECQSLQTTALVHEAYLRLVGVDQAWSSRAQFFAAAAEAMRRILVERARQKKQLKRGGDRHRVMLDDAIAHIEPPAEELLYLHEVLDRFAAGYPAKADLVKLRYFAGFTTSEAAEALGITTRTAERYWAFAKAWLFREMQR